MSIEDRVKQAVEANSTERNKEQDFAKLRDFYTQAQQAGIAQKQTYTIPPLDTVGQRLYQMTVTKQSG